MRPNARPGSVRRLARRGLIEADLRGETLRRVPNEADRGVGGVEHLSRALELGRGAVLVTAHLGSLSALAVSLVARDYDVKLVVTSSLEHVDDARPHRTAARDAIGRFKVAFGDRIIETGDSYSVIVAELYRGAACMLALDVGGSVETSFAGHRASLPWGPAGLALETGAPIVPTFPVRSTRRAGFLLPHIDPARFAGHRDLHDHLASVVGGVRFTYVERSYPGTSWLRDRGLDRFAVNLSEHRRDAGLSRRELARTAGIRQRRVGRLEEALADPTLEELRRLARPLGIKPSRLLNRVS